MIELSDEKFEEEIQKLEKPVLIDFWAEWCFPCKVFAPTFEKLSKDFEEKVVFAKVNIDQAPLTAQKFKIERIPSIVLFKEGRPVSGFVGVLPEEAIKDWINKTLDGTKS
jgi:thioredoxin 1